MDNLMLMVLPDSLRYTSKLSTSKDKIRQLTRFFDASMYGFAGENCHPISN